MLNKFKTIGNIVEIYTSKNETIIIDIDDLELIKQHTWLVDSKGYVRGGHKSFKLHRLIMNTPDYLVVDHINHDKLDNRKINLRNITNQQNCMNNRAVGVNINRGKWRAYLMKNGKNYCKWFNTKKEALSYRKELEINHFGEFRYDIK